MYSTVQYTTHTVITVQYSWCWLGVGVGVYELHNCGNCTPGQKLWFHCFLTYDVRRIRAC
jgi:hypothetical protein